MINSAARDWFMEVIRDVQVAYCDFSDELGNVIAVHGRVAPELPLIVHIQDTYENPTAQKNIASILEWLVIQFELDLIFIEEDVGDVSQKWSSYRQYNLGFRRLLADMELNSGNLNGATYAYIVSERKLTLWGVENDTLRKENVEARDKVKSYTKHTTDLINSLQTSLDKLILELVARRLINEEFYDLIARIRNYANGSLNLNDYVETLVRFAESHGVATHNYPNCTRLLAQLRFTTQTNSELIQEAVRTNAKDLATDEEFRQLKRVADKARVRGGRHTREYYEELERILIKRKMDLDKFPNLVAYLDVLRQNRDMDMVSITGELERFKWHLLTVMGTTMQGRAIAKIVKQLEVIGSLLHLKLAAHDYRFVPASYWLRAFENNIGFLRNELLACGLSTSVLPSLDKFEIMISDCQRFYDLACERGTFQAKNASEKLLETHKRIAVLVTGGFHSSRITRYLKDKGFGVITLTPNI